MSTAKRSIEEKRSKQPKRRYGGAPVESGSADWATVGAENILECIIAAVEVGGALRFGTTSDGGAYALGVYGDGPAPYTLYSGSDEGMREHLRGVAAAFEAEAKERQRNSD